VRATSKVDRWMRVEKEMIFGLTVESAKIEVLKRYVSWCVFVSVSSVEPSQPR
jgi:putative transposon-encoded protein